MRHIYAPERYEQPNEAQFRAEVERTIGDLSRLTDSYTLSASNPNSRDVAALATLPEVIALLQTLVHDLKSKGVLG